MWEIRTDAQPEKLYIVLDFLDGILEECGCPAGIKIKLEVAVEEIFVNIAHYAYTPDVGDAEITVEVTDDRVAKMTFADDSGRVLTLIFEDTGIPYDPLAKPDPDITLSAEERQIGGLGIFMVKKSMDSMEYERRDDKNILTIKKKLA